MASIRSAGQFVFQNVGPLTSTFTAPPSCPSTNPNIRGLEYPEFEGFLIVKEGACTTSKKDPQCTPNGDAIESLYKSVDDNWDRYNPTGHIAFHSPGNACPSGWETAGVVSTKNGTIEATGLFKSTAFHFETYPNVTGTMPPADFALNVMTSVLAPTETAIVCCPSGFKADHYFGCYSHFDASELSGSTGCATITSHGGDGPEIITETRSFEYFGTPVTYSTILIGPPTGTASEPDTTNTVTYSFDASGKPNDTDLAPFPVYAAETLRGIERADMVYLVNVGEGNSTKEDDDSGAQSLTGSSFAVLATVATVWAVGFLAVCSL